MFTRSGFQSAASLGTGVLASIILLQPAYAATRDQIVERCRQALHPQVQACAQAKGLQGNPEAIRERCGKPIVSPCVRREEQKAAAGKPAPQAPKDDTAAGLPNTAPLKPLFVAPPRTIADITAILNSEKPDNAKIAARKAAADVTPPQNAPATELAQFYYDRGNARALLAYNKEALADGLQAMAIGKGVIEYGRFWRIQQFVALQYRATGDPKQAIAIFDSMARQGDQPGHQGSMINALANLAQTFITMGDVSQAGTYAGRVEALVQEARGSPNPNWRQSYSVYGHSWGSRR